ncbi:hypothetical protein HDV00_011801 [Rhizophlyctis rosea]|nr:hypothetical protein HDV00_011801 [Rhizophlyctis rosea]
MKYENGVSWWTVGGGTVLTAASSYAAPVASNGELSILFFIPNFTLLRSVDRKYNRKTGFGELCIAFNIMRRVTRRIAVTSPLIGGGGVFLAMVAVGALFGRKRAKSELKVNAGGGKSNGSSMEEARSPTSPTPIPESRSRTQSMSSSWKSSFGFGKVMRGRKDSTIEERPEDDASSDSSTNASMKTVKTTGTSKTAESSRSRSRSRSLSVSAPSSPVPFNHDDAPPLPADAASLTLRGIFTDKEKERQKERERKGKARSTSPVRPPLQSTPSSSSILQSPTISSPLIGSFFHAPIVVPSVIPSQTTQEPSGNNTGSDLSDSSDSEDTRLRIRLIYGPPPRHTGGSSAWEPPCEVGTMCKVLISHAPDEVDEMMIRRGELVRVEAFYEDGWVRVKLDDPMYNGGKIGTGKEQEKEGEEKEEKESKPSRWAIVSRSKKPKDKNSANSLTSPSSPNLTTPKSPTKSKTKTKSKAPGTLGLERVQSGMVPWHCLQVATDEDAVDRQRQYVALVAAQQAAQPRSPLQDSMQYGFFAKIG